MSVEILSQIKTKEDILTFVSFLDEFVQSKFTNTKPSSKLPPRFEAAVKKLEGLSSSEITQLRKDIVSQDTFIFKMPFAPSQNFKEALHTLLMEKGNGSHFIIETVVSPEMDFGVTFSVNGKYSQIFLKDRILNFLKNHHAI
jgi:hypothetical protein